ncbi:hypothetical protein F4811DRAFT_532900 [Daldinia bambusicola]|nr:hypothetical protein F4811DRAFT_532900 [Daldinia bambusicola]
MVIDYSKWDNLDTDSEPEESSAPSVPAPRALAPAQAPAQATPQSSEPTTASSAASSASESILGVIIRCDGERATKAPWSAVMLNPDHVVFSEKVPPIPTLIGIPLAIRRLGTRAADRCYLDNQIVTYLNIDAESGFAPPEWQSHIGTVVAARLDKKPLLPQHLEGVWMFCDHILDIFGEDGSAPTRLYNRQAFETWWEEYCENHKRTRPGTGGEMDPDDWRAVPSPYEM